MAKNALFAFITAVVLSIASARDDVEWREFKAKYGKNYTSPAQDSLRFLQYRSVRHQVKLVNSKPGNPWIAGHNVFSDWTEEEKEKRYGLRIPKDNETIDEPANETFQFDARQSIPTFFNYQNHMCMQPIGYQGRCGSCWAFTAIHSLEFAMCRRVNSRRSLSLQQLMDCNKDGVNVDCVGGYITNAWNYLRLANGSFSAASYPYISGTTSTGGSCRRINPINIQARVSFFGSVAQNVAAIQQAIMRYGSVAATFKGTNMFNVYRAGIFVDNHCNTGYPNHSVNIIGWGTEVSSLTGIATRFWIVRNSWGLTWGDAGYFRIPRGVNMCFIEQAVKYVVPF